jgi:hypothetical protein
METRKRVLGEEHPDTLASIANLESICRKKANRKRKEALATIIIHHQQRHNYKMIQFRLHMAR